MKPNEEMYTLGEKKTPWLIASVLNIDPIQKRKSFLSME